MGTINVYHDEDDKTYQVNATLKQGLLAPDQNTGGTGRTDAANEVYVEITTNMKKADGTSFPKFIVRSLSDCAPTVAYPSFSPTCPATSWTVLINDYVNYFLNAAQFAMSSSSFSSSSVSSFSSLSSLSSPSSGSSSTNSSSSESSSSGV